MAEVRLHSMFGRYEIELNKLSDKDCEEARAWLVMYGLRSQQNGDRFQPGDTARGIIPFDKLKEFLNFCIDCNLITGKQAWQEVIRITTLELKGQHPENNPDATLEESAINYMRAREAQLLN